MFARKNERDKGSFNLVDFEFSNKTIKLNQVQDDMILSTVSRCHVGAFTWEI